MPIIQVRGGWPALPADAKLAPGVSGPNVTVLRRRLVITEDLAADKRTGDTYDDAVLKASSVSSFGTDLKRRASSGRKP